MNKEKALERLTALEAEAKTLREILEAPEKKERWRAKQGERFYLINVKGDIFDAKENSNIIDNLIYDNFNHFQFPTEAERIARVQLAYRKLDWAIRQFELSDTTGHVIYITPNGDLNSYPSEGKVSSLPRLENNSDAQYIISNYKAELLTFLTGGEK